MRHRLKMLRMIIIINSVYRCLFMLLKLEWNMPFANLGSKSTSTSASQKVACKHLGVGLCSFIHSGYLYNASSSPLLLRGAPDYSFIHSFITSIYIAPLQVGLLRGALITALILRRS